jgi:hypothetical protein
MNFLANAPSSFRAALLGCACAALALPNSARAQGVSANAAQQLVFAGLRSIGAKGQIQALGTDSAGDVYLAFDQGDGVRVLKVANDGVALLAQVQLGAAGDSVTALAVDVSGNVYVAGTSTSGSLEATSGAAVGAATVGTTSSFVAKFDANLNSLFVTFTGGTRIAASALAASGDSVFVTGITYGNDLPVSANAVQQAPAPGSTQNGFVEAFSADGTTLEFATYVTGAQGDTTPTGIAVDAGDDVWLVGSTTASGFPTSAAVVPEMLSNPSGFLLRLTPAGDGIVYSTFVPGAGLSSVTLDSTGLNLLISGQVALGQFPVDTVTSLLVPTAYQALLRMSLDGSTVVSGTVVAPGQQSVVTAASGGAAWVGGSFTPGTAPLLPQSALSTIGNAYAVRVTPAAGVDQTVRWGGLADFDQTYASVPVAVNGLAADGAGALFVGGSAQPTASANLLATETYDFPMLAGPTAALPSAIADAVASSTSCAGSLCSGSGGYLAKVNPNDAGPALALSMDGAPLVTVHNLGSAAAEGLQLTSSAGTLTTNCGSELAAGGECDALLLGGGPGTLTASASNGGTASGAFGTYPAGGASSGIAFVPKELDFGIQTAEAAASTPALKTITVTNLGSETATFSEGIAGTPKSSTPFREVASSCPTAGASGEKVLAAGASCTITIDFSAFSDSSNDGFVQGQWSIGPGEVFLTGYSQSANLSVSAGEVDFGTQFPGGLTLPRYLYLSNASEVSQMHAQVSLPTGSPFSIVDGCPSSLPPGSVCRMRVDYLSSVVPSVDSVTLTLDEGLSVLLTGQTMVPQSAGGSAGSSNLSVSPSSATFGDAVVVTGVSTVTQTVSVTNSGMTAVPLSVGMQGDFTDVTSCGSLLAPGSTCAVVITFTPSAPGVRQGLLTFSTGAGTQPLTVALSGTGESLLAANNGSLSFSGTSIGQPLVKPYKVTQAFDNLSVQATGPYLVTLVEDVGFGFGNPPSSSYGPTASGTCHNCWLGVFFQPTAAGEQAGTVSFSSNPNGLAYVLQLAGSGVATSGLVLSPTVSDFGVVPVNSVSGGETFTLTNLLSSGQAVQISAVTPLGDFQLDSAAELPTGCAGDLPYMASCSLAVQFAPTATGIRSGSLQISTSAGVASASLSGTGGQGTAIAISPVSLTFANIPGQAGRAQTVSLLNTGTQTAGIGAPTTGSTNFTFASGCGALAPGATCAIQVSFTPGAHPVSDVLSIPFTSEGAAGDSAMQTLRVGLSGTFSTLNEGLAISPGTLAFGPAATASVSSARLVTVTNLSAKQAVMAVMMPRSYVLQENSCGTLAPGASCVLTISFVPLENGDLPGTIFITASPTDGSPSSIGVLYADGFGLGSGTLTISGGLIVSNVFNFGSTALGQGASQVFSLTNTGIENVTVRRVVTQPPFFSTTTCGGLLTPGSSCSAMVVYSPLGSATGTSSTGAPVPDLGSITVESDAQTSPNVLDLEGTSTSAPGSGGSSALASFSLSEGALTFEPTTVGDVSAAQTVVLTNTGTSTLHVSSVSTTADFSVQNGCGTVLSGASCTMMVASTPQSAGVRIGALAIASDAASSLDYVTLFGPGVSSLLVFSPASLRFDDVLVGSMATQPVVVTNSGEAGITFNSVAVGGEFAVSGDCPRGGASLPAQASCTEQVTFAPASAGAAASAVSFATSASTFPLTVPVSGKGIQPELAASPANLSFGPVQLGSSMNLALQLVNQSPVPVSMLTPVVTGDFALTLSCAGSTLAAGAICIAQVTFTPTRTGARNGTLTIASSDPASPLTVALTGTGSSPAGFTLTVNAGSSATESVNAGGYTTFALLATPSGGFAGTIALTCTPVQPVAYASCSILPSQVSLTSGAQGSTATINTEERSVGLLKRTSRGGSDSACLAMLPACALLIFWRARTPRLRSSLRIVRWLGQGVPVAGFLCAILISGCGPGGGPGPEEHDTPPGQYQFEVTASSTSGLVSTQTVLLNLVVVSP